MNLDQIAELARLVARTDTDAATPGELLGTVAANQIALAKCVGALAEHLKGAQL